MEQVNSANSQTRGVSAPEQIQANELRPSRIACLEIVGDDEDLLFVDGHDDAIVGIAERGGVSLVVYESVKVMAKLRKRDGMSRDEAEEFFAVNIAVAWFGDMTPIYFTRIKRKNAESP